MLVVRKQNTTDSGASLPSLQPVERPAESALEGSGQGHWMESRQMPVWRENPFLTTTATQLGRGLSDGGCTEIQG